MLPALALPDGLSIPLGSHVHASSSRQGWLVQTGILRARGCRRADGGRGRGEQALRVAARRRLGPGGRVGGRGDAARFVRLDSPLDFQYYIIIFGALFFVTAIGNQLAAVFFGHPRAAIS